MRAGNGANVSARTSGFPRYAEGGTNEVVGYSVRLPGAARVGRSVLLLDAKAEAWLSHEQWHRGSWSGVVPPPLAVRSLGSLGAAGSRAWWRWRTWCRWR